MDTEILVHVKAPGRVHDDSRYRAITENVLNFKGATIVKVFGSQSEGGESDSDRAILGTNPNTGRIWSQEKGHPIQAAAQSRQHKACHPVHISSTRKRKRSSPNTPLRASKITDSFVTTKSRVGDEQDEDDPQHGLFRPVPKSLIHRTSFGERQGLCKSQSNIINDARPKTAPATLVELIVPFTGNPIRQHALSDFFSFASDRTTVPESQLDLSPHTHFGWSTAELCETPVYRSLGTEPEAVQARPAKLNQPAPQTKVNTMNLALTASGSQSTPAGFEQHATDHTSHEVSRKVEAKMTDLSDDVSEVVSAITLTDITNKSSDHHCAAQSPSSSSDTCTSSQKTMLTTTPSKPILHADNIPSTHLSCPGSPEKFSFVDLVTPASNTIGTEWPSSLKKFSKNAGTNIRTSKDRNKRILKAIQALDWKVDAPDTKFSAGGFRTAITPRLEIIEHSLPIKLGFLPAKVERDIRALERGYWKIVIKLTQHDEVIRWRKANVLLQDKSVYEEHQHSPWTAGEFFLFYNRLVDSIRGNHFGYVSLYITETTIDRSALATSAVRVALRLYSWGESAAHLYTAMRWASEDLIKLLPIAWIGCDGKQVINMAGRTCRQAGPESGLWVQKGGSGKEARFGLERDNDYSSVTTAARA